MTSCFTSRSISAIRAASKPARARILASDARGNHAAFREHVADGEFDAQPEAVARLVGP